MAPQDQAGGDGDVSGGVWLFCVPSAQEQPAKGSGKRVCREIPAGLQALGVRAEQLLGESGITVVRLTLSSSKPRDGSGTAEATFLPSARDVGLLGGP